MQARLDKLTGGKWQWRLSRTETEDGKTTEVDFAGSLEPFDTKQEAINDFHTVATARLHVPKLVDPDKVEAELKFKRAQEAEDERRKKDREERGVKAKAEAAKRAKEEKAKQARIAAEQDGE